MNVAVRTTPAQDIAQAPLETLNPSMAQRFQDDAMWPVFARLRREDPVHFTAQSEFGPYWSITRWDDIMAIDTDHENFSSADGITLTRLDVLAMQDQISGGRRRGAGFITMDPPDHSARRKAVAPTVAPVNLALMAPQVRERAGAILDELPIGQEFDWVDKVSKELTAMTLATLFDFPFEERRRLTHWSDMFTNVPGHGPVGSWDQKRDAAFECFSAFNDLWSRKAASAPANDLISMLAHGPATRHMSVDEYQGTVVLLIIGGNDTTRNTITGSVYALDRNPIEAEKLRADLGLIPSMVSETIRWQTPLAHMRRTAVRDVVFRGKSISKGDKVVMWYVSGNRDEAVFDDPDAFRIDRPNPRHHMSFGFGIHRCVGNRVAEMQLQIIWEEIIKRFPSIKVMGEPLRTYSAFVKGYETLPVMIPSCH